MSISLIWGVGGFQMGRRLVGARGGAEATTLRVPEGC